MTTDTDPPPPDLRLPYCFVILEGERDPEGYVPCLVVEGETGYYPLRGSGRCATPWYWGTTREQADAICRQANANRGVSEEDAARMVAASMGLRALSGPSASPPD